MHQRGTRLIGEKSCGVGLLKQSNRLYVEANPYPVARVWDILKMHNPVARVWDILKMHNPVARVWDVLKMHNPAWRALASRIF